LEQLVSDELRYPDEWEELTAIHVLDPDGWRVDGKNWYHPITREEFLRRVVTSTVLNTWAAADD
jgi:hypothetical protein